MVGSFDLVRVNDAVGSNIFIVGSCRMNHRTKVSSPSVPSLSLLLGLMSKSRMHISFVLYRTTFFLEQRFCQVKVFIKGELPIILLSPRTPV